MLIPRHPKPVVSPKAVATQVVKQEHREIMNTHVIVVEKPVASATAMPQPKPGT